MASDLPIKLMPEGTMTNSKISQRRQPWLRRFRLLRRRLTRSRNITGAKIRPASTAATARCSRAGTRSAAERGASCAGSVATAGSAGATSGRAPPPVQSRQAAPRAQQQPRVEAPRADNRRGDERRNERADDHRNEVGRAVRERMSDRAAAFTVHVIRRATHRACMRRRGYASASLLSSVRVPAARTRSASGSTRASRFRTATALPYPI